MPLHHHGGTPHTKSQQREKAEQEITLEQAAGQTQHDVDAEPFDNGRWERAVDDHLAGHTPAPTSGGTMSQLSDLANQVGSHVDMQEVLAALAQAEQLISGKREALAGLLADTAHAGGVEGAAAEASQAIANALPAVTAFGEAIGAAAGAIRGG